MMLTALFRQLISGKQVAPSQEGDHFFDHLMTRFFTHLGAIQHENIDRDRFSVPLGHTLAFSPEHAHRGYCLVRDHATEIEQVLRLFEDAQSRTLYEDLILYRMLGHCYVRLQANNPQHWEMRAIARSLRSGDSHFTGMFGQLERFRVEFLGEPLDVQCDWANVAWSFLMRQYYFDRGGVTIAPSPGDHVIDAGACYGDTALGFAAAVGTSGRVFAFDIMPLHIDITKANLQSNPALAPRIAVMEAALADRDDQPLYIHGDGPGARVSAAPSAHQVNVTTIDKFVAEHNLPIIDFIKMDIEGSESAALAGALDTLNRWRPKLAISLYHQPKDIFRIPLYLNALGLGYAFYLDHYTIHHEETVLYAVPRD